jgi:hypothetical protein
MDIQHENVFNKKDKYIARKYPLPHIVTIVEKQQIPISQSLV